MRCDIIPQKNLSDNYTCPLMLSYETLLFGYHWRRQWHTSYINHWASSFRLAGVVRHLAEEGRCKRIMLSATTSFCLLVTLAVDGGDALSCFETTGDVSAFIIDRVSHRHP